MLDGHGEKPRRLPELPRIISVLSLIISIVTVSAVYLQIDNQRTQLGKMQDQIDLSINDAYYAKSFQLSQVWLEHPDLWPYFHEGKEVEPDSPPDKLAQLRAVGFMSLDFFEQSEIQSMRDPRDVQGSAAYITDAVKNSPFLRSLFRSSPSWWPRLQPYFDVAPKP